MNGKKYDVAIIGAGPAGLFCAYELTTKNPHAKVLVIEEGLPIQKRLCPLAEGKTERCIKCKTCAITHGSAGAGAFSDGKLNIPHRDERRVRGNLGHHLTLREAQDLFKYTDNLYLRFGANPQVEGEEGPQYIERELRYFLDKAELKADCSRIRHLGTDGAREVYSVIESELTERIDFLFETKCEDISVTIDRKIDGLIISDSNNSPKRKIEADYVVMAVGRSGTSWLEKIANRHNLVYSYGVADIGVRFELSDTVMSEINKNLYEGKIFGRCKGNMVRTFCQNPSGKVSTESYEGALTLVNGHANKDTALSQNTNLALLVSVMAGNTNAYARSIAKTVNELGKGLPVIQRLEDAQKSERTTKYRLRNNRVKPTLEFDTETPSVVPADLTLGLPKQIMDSLLDFISRMEIVVPGFSDPDNLMYGPEIKFYSLALALTKECETTIKGLYGIGDGSGPTHGLMPASVNGVALGRYLASKI